MIVHAFSMDQGRDQPHSVVQPFARRKASSKSSASPDSICRCRRSSSVTWSAPLNRDEFDAPVARRLFEAAARASIRCRLRLRLRVRAAGAATAANRAAAATLYRHRPSPGHGRLVSRTHHRACARVRVPAPRRVPGVHEPRRHVRAAAAACGRRHGQPIPRLVGLYTSAPARRGVLLERVIARTLRSDGLAVTTWFLFDKSDFPMMQDFQNALYISDFDPTNAVIFDRRWLEDTVTAAGLEIESRTEPVVRGHQWAIQLRRR